MRRMRCLWTTHYRIGSGNFRFVALNGVLHFLWWNKLKDVSCSVCGTQTQTTDSEYGDPDHNFFSSSSVHSDMRGEATVDFLDHEKIR